MLIALGTDHEEYFVRELYYAVAPSGTIYTYDLLQIPGMWFKMKQTTPEEREVTMKKRISVLMLTLALCLSLGAPALAAGGFSDVAQNAWYLKYLDTAVSSGSSMAGETAGSLPMTTSPAQRL